MPDQPLAEGELITVFDTEQETEAQVVRALLESASIEVQFTSRELQQDVFPGTAGTLIRVRPDQADEARQIIEAYRANPVSDVEVTESAEPPSEP
jgi:hypothetical protein